MSIQAENAKFTSSRLFDVDGWVCVVTGGGTGLGLMIAQAFANNGARVYIAGRREAALHTATDTWAGTLAHSGGRIVPVQADCADKAGIEGLVAEVGRRESRVDVLVNNAGVSMGTSEVEQGEESAEALRKELWSEEVREWEEVYRTNVIGHFFTAVTFLPLLSAAARDGHTGSVIEVSSMSGLTRTSQHHVKYNVSKAAAVQLTRLLAQEFRRPGVRVRVNSIAPGIFPSEMTAKDSDKRNKSEIETPADYGDKKGIPAGRPGREEDMAQTALFLACNEYVYGQTVAVEGGYLLEHP